MSNALKEERPLDANKININQPYEVNWWINELNVSQRQLEDAVREVGVYSLAVRRHLKKK